MDENQADPPIHPVGELPEADEELTAERPSAAMDSLGGKLFVRWDPDAAATAFGPVAYFIEFLKANELWQRWVEDCPLASRSLNAPPKQGILGTLLLSLLAGHKRYAHVTTLSPDQRGHSAQRESCHMSNGEDIFG